MYIEGTFLRVKVSIRSDWSQQTENRIAKKKKKMISRCKEKTQQSFPEYHYYNLVNITISHSGLKPLHTSYKF
jgi:hypothetical protein